MHSTGCCSAFLHQPGEQGFQVPFALPLGREGYGSIPRWQREREQGGKQWYCLRQRQGIRRQGVLELAQLGVWRILVGKGQAPLPSA